MLACLSDPPPASVPASAGALGVLLGDRARLIGTLRDVDAIAAELDALQGAVGGLRAELVGALREVEGRIRDERQRDGG